MDESALVIDCSTLPQCSRGAHAHSREEHDAAAVATVLHVSVSSHKGGKPRTHVVCMDCDGNEGAAAAERRLGCMAECCVCTKNMRAAVRGSPLPIVRMSIEDCLAAASAASVQYDGEQRGIDGLNAKG